MEEKKLALLIFTIVAVIGVVAVVMLLKGGVTGNATAGPGQYGVYVEGFRSLNANRMSGAQNTPYAQRLVAGGINSYEQEQYAGSYSPSRFQGGISSGSGDVEATSKETPYVAQAANYNNPDYTYKRNFPVSSDAYVSPEDAKSDWYTSPS